MPELLHAGALAATAVGTCCTAAAARRTRMQELGLALVMLLAMADVVLGWGLLAPVWWATLLVGAALMSVVVVRGNRGAADRPARAMDGLGAVLMAVMIVLMAGGGSPGDHAGHGVSSALLVCAVMAACVAFAAASVRMSATMRMPRLDAPARVRVLRRVAPLAMAASVLLMAGVVVM